MRTAVNTVSLGVFVPVADHGDILSTLPFFLPALLIVGGLLALRALERRRHDAGDS
jgi:hypothetical protein